MALPEPHPGLVIRYAYLWANEKRSGREEGQKDRPCAIVMARQIVETTVVVTVVAITHTRPSDSSAAFELPAAIKRHLGLDDQPSWIALDEVNDFLWPGPDLVPLPGSNPAKFDYGVLPPGYFKQARDRLVALAKEKRITRVRRTE